MIVILFAAAALHAGSAPEAAARPLRYCSLRSLSACRNTNQLFYDPSFRRNLKRFAGMARITALGRNQRLSGLLINTLGGPPDRPVKLPDGNLLFTACIAHDCGDDGAIILTPGGAIVAAATFTVQSVHDQVYERLNIYVRARANAAGPSYRAIVDWAKAAYEDERRAGYLRPAGLTEAVWLVRGRAVKLQKIGSRTIVCEPAR